MCEDQFIKHIKDKFGTLVSHFNKNGWREDCPSESSWYFHKKGRYVTLNWFTGSVSYERVLKNKA